MNERAKFEAWHGAIGVFARYASTGAYANSVIESQWLAWQASRQQALEEAAVICDIQAGDHEFIFVDFKAAEGCSGCARAIRSLTTTGDKA